MNRQERLVNLSAYLDGELDDAEERRLAAWCERHPEDVQEFEAINEVVALVRELPQVDPPVGLKDAVRRAVAHSAPVEVGRAQAVEWLDKYFDDELPAPQRAVVEHYLAVDPEFAETAAMHVAMLEALTDVAEQEPPADLRQRIEARVRNAERGATARRSRPTRDASVWVRRALTVGVAALLIFAVGRVVVSGGDDGERVADEPAAVDPAAPIGAVATEDTGAEPLVEPAAPTYENAAEPELPADEGAEPLVEDGMTPAAPAARPGVNVPRPAPSGRQIAEQERAPRSPAPRSSRPRSSAPSTPPSRESAGEAAAPERDGDAPEKTTPPASPAPLPSEGFGQLAAPGGESGAIDASGNGSVLDADSRVGSGNPEAGERSRSAENPTRRIEVPAF